MMLSNRSLERRNHGALLCRVVLGLTCYFEEPPTRDQIVRAYSAYRRICPSEDRELVTTVRQSLFLSFEADDVSHLNRILVDQDRRRDDGVVVWNGSESRQWMFWMQGSVGEDVDGDCASFCQVIIPESADPKLLYQFARELGGEVPMLSGHGGYTVQYSARFKKAAFDQIYKWAKRFIGLEVEDLDCTLPNMLDSAKGANWITLVGNKFWMSLPDKEGLESNLPNFLSLEVLKYARVFKAGLNPTLGDRNRKEFPQLYAAVERIIAPIKVRGHPEFPGRFGEEEETAAWLHRLSDPDAW